MNQTSANFPELGYLSTCLTASTRMRLSRALIDALRGSARIPRRQFDIAVSDASIELRLGGLDDSPVLDFLAATVENAGRACGADRPSLMTGELRWVPVQVRVLAAARAALGILPLSPVCAIGAETVSG
jgi:hypothetical protein